MINQFMVVGRLISDPTLEETKTGKKTIINLEVPRSYKNLNGEYEKDFIDITVFQQQAEATSEYCKKSDVIGVRGRIEKLENKDIRLVAEKVTFLSGKGE